MRAIHEGELQREQARPRPVAASPQPSASPAPAVVRTERSRVAVDVPVPTPPFWGSRVVEKIPLKAALAYLNEVMLFQVQWEYRKKGRPQAEFDRYIDTEVRPIYRDLVAQCEREGILQPRAIYGYWPCQSEGNTLLVYAPEDRSRVIRVRVSPPGQGASLVPGRFLAAAEHGRVRRHRHVHRDRRDMLVTLKALDEVHDRFFSVVVQDVNHHVVVEVMEDWVCNFCRYIFHFHTILFSFLI
jgi:cobalamin-dependent methionine synthase I